ncbi:MAG: homocysteine S-methyltransferase family protein [Candidatus Hydrogenedentes bacterium]|nr:homocysteine S-methyltransferase family protein [Candidatus Hydrogenedentota bacterium]
MKSICEKVEERGILISDGAWGTFLIANGLKAGECPELWNVEHPDVVRGIAEKYVAVGSDIITTNSFGGSRLKLDAYGLADRTVELNRAAARLSREAAGDDVNVAASIGPSGKILMMQDITEEELADVFREQAIALEEGGADACCVETMSAIDESVIAVRAIKESTNLEIICSFTYDSEVAGTFRTMMGASPAEMATALLDAGADILGTNCSQGSENMIGVVRALRSAAPDTPILVHPNAGMPILTDDGETYPETPAFMAGCVPTLIEAGANIVGGCCGTSPDHIRAIRESAAQA